jgi:low affinity Fe/Cu permease
MKRVKQRRAERAETAAVAEEPVDEALERESPFKAWFGKVATRVSDTMGSAWAFSAAVLIILLWIVTGPVFGFSDTWQLAINTGTTIVTFLMVFLIQNTQNRDAKATELKLDELIRAIGEARNQFIGAEGESEDRLARELKQMETERDKPNAPARDERATPPPAHNGKPNNGERAQRR